MAYASWGQADADIRMALGLPPDAALPSGLTSARQGYAEPMSGRGIAAAGLQGAGQALLAGMVDPNRRKGGGGVKGVLARLFAGAGAGFAGLGEAQSRYEAEGLQRAVSRGTLARQGEGLRAADEQKQRVLAAVRDDPSLLPLYRSGGAEAVAAVLLEREKQRAQPVKWQEGGSDATGRYLFNPNDPTQRMPTASPYRPAADSAGPEVVVATGVQGGPGTPRPDLPDGVYEVTNRGSWRRMGDRNFTGVATPDAPMLPGQGTGQPLQPVQTSVSPKQLEQEKNLRGEIKTLPAYQNYAQIAPAAENLNRALESNDRQAAINAIYALGKIIDPTSIVREGEVSMYSSAGNPVIDQFNTYIRSLATGGSLPPEAKKGLAALAASRVRVAQDDLQKALTPMRRTVEQTGLDWRRIAPEFGPITPPSPALMGRQPQAVDPALVGQPGEW